jgi:F-type H+-transporting ATPase subunit b
MTLIQFGNFLLTLLFLNYILIRPIRRLLREREDNMSKLLAEADDFAQKADARLTKYEEALALARAEATEQRSALKAEGLAEEVRMMETAAGEAHKVLLSAREEIDKEAKQAMSEFNLKVDELARQAATRILS